MNTDLYAMNLGEMIEYNYMSILRVPSGWVYIFEEAASVFVPFYNEFQKSKSFNPLIRPSAGKRE